MTTPIRPIQLISFTSDKKLQVNIQAINWLKNAQKVDQNKHIGVITVVGKYRTGKSYILNRVLLGQNSGFEVGPTINACTKGLWVWPQLLDCPDDPTLQYLVMDTEGLGSLEEGEQTDTKIFLMAMLLSSYFIYNSQGNIDEKAVQSLSLIINLNKLLQKGGQSQMQDILNCFPSFLWLVRDFALKLVDETNTAISPKQYLENALRLQSGSSETTVRKNSVRKEMLNFFRDRDCFMMIRPVDDEKKLQNMSKLKDSELRPEFLQLVKELQDKIFKAGKKKTFKGKPCSPSMFIDLCQHFCDSMNKGGLPEIESNWELVCKAEATRVEKKCLEDFDLLVKKYEKMDCKRVDLQQLEEEISRKIVQTLKYYEKHAIGNKEDKRRILKEKLQIQFIDLKAKISEEKNQDMDDNLTEISAKLDKRINQNEIDDIFEITAKYDEFINAESKAANSQTMGFLYKRTYQTLKSSAITYFGATYQTHNYENNLLSEKLNIYKNSLNKIQGDNSKRNTESDERERELRQKVYELQVKTKSTIKQYEKAKRQLERMQKHSSLGKQNIPMLY